MDRLPFLKRSVCIVHSALLAAAVLLTGPLAVAQAKKTGMPPVLRIAIDAAYPPFTVIGPDQRAHGAIVEMWRLWSRATKVPIEFVASDWAGTLEAVRSGRADVHFGLFENEERAKWLDFSDPIHEIRTGVYFPAHRADLPSLSGLVGATVGVVDEFMQERYLEQNYPDINLKTYVDGRAAFIGLLNGEIEALVNEVPNVEAELARFGMRGAAKRGPGNLLNNTMHAGALKGRKQLLERINAGFAAIPIVELIALDERWFASPADRYYKPNQTSVALTDAETQWLKAHPVIRFAVTNFITPVDIVAEDGTYSGLNADLIALLNRKIGSNIVPEFYGQWSEVVDSALSGQVDGAMSFSRTPEREKRILYTDPFAFDPVIAITTVGNNEIKSPADLKDKAVSAVKGLAFIELIRKDVGDGEVRVFDSDVSALGALAKGEVDAHISTQFMFVNAQAKSFTPGLKVPASRRSEGGALRIGVHKSQPVLFAIIQKALDAISRDELAALRAKWSTPRKSAASSDAKIVTLSPEEAIWLQKNRSFTLGVDPAWAPFEFIDDDGRYSGIAAGYIEEVSKRLDIGLTPRQGQTWAEVLELARRGEIDVLPAVTRTPSREKFLHFTKPYVTFPMVIATRKDAPFVDGVAGLAGKKVGVVKGYVSEEIIGRDYRDVSLVAFVTLGEGLQAVERGDIDAFIDNLATITYEIESRNLDALKIAAPTEYAFELAMAVREDLPQLAAILDKTLDTISDRERAAIKNAWIAVRVNLGTSLRTILLYAVPILVVVVFVGIAFYMWNRRLGQEVKERKQAEAQLSQSLAELKIAEEKTRSIIENAADGIVVITAQGVVQSFSPAAERIFGYSASEIIGQNVELLMPQTERAGHQAYVDRFLETRKPKIVGRNREVVGQRKDGSQFPMDLAVGEAMLGGEQSFTGIVRDITDRKKAEEALRVGEERLELALKSGDLGYWDINFDTGEKAVNEKWAALLGYSLDEVDDFEVIAQATFHPDDIERLNDYNARYAAGEFTNYQAEYRIVTKQGETRWQLSKADAVARDENGKPLRLAGTVQDITDRKLAEQELEDAYEVITSSIEYASNIQRSLLPRPEFLAEDLREYFVIWQPRDVVGGDLYWYRRCDGGFVIVLADCTGHGVPGAFMTMLSTGALDRALRDYRDGDPAELLARMNRSIQMSLGQDQEESESDDGLELGICRIASDTGALVYAGARFSLFQVNGEQVREIKGDKSGIGYRHIPTDQTFTNHAVEIAKDDAFYMTSDGLIDQIGGAKRRSFGKRRLMKLITAIQHLPIAEQQNRILAALDEHQGDEPRRDDVSVFGFRV